MIVTIQPSLAIAHKLGQPQKHVLLDRKLEPASLALAPGIIWPEKCPAFSNSQMWYALR
jgi:hypothetical protein